MEIKGAEVWVTGGGSGLGAATAKHFAALGAHVVAVDLNTDGVPPECEAIRLDITDEWAVERAFSDRKPRVLVNCAGIAPAAKVVGREGRLSTALFQKTIQVNLVGSFVMLSHAARAMSAQDPVGEERGVIINTASIAYQDGQVGQTAYAASKGGIASLTLPAARDLAPLGIRVMAIAPGLFNTPMMQALPEETTKGIIGNIPFPHRLGSPQEYALLAQQIVENPYLNGEVIRLDAAVRLPQR